MPPTTKSRKAATAPDEGKVRLTLAHPIGPAYQAGLGLAVKDGEDYGVNEEIDVWPHVARAIINAGYAQVDPENPEAVAKALGISTEAAEVLVGEMAGGGTVEPASEPTG